MTSDILMNAILSLDAYNRGYDAGVQITEPDDITPYKVGNATFLKQSSVAESSEGVTAGFYAIAYSYNGETVISYRGTDDYDGITSIPSSLDAANGWPMGGGSITTAQGRMALEFYKDVADLPYGSDLRNVAITLTGHSLGGGLAGYVASLYGQNADIFDSMAFKLAATATINVAYHPEYYTDPEYYPEPIFSDAQELVYNGYSTPWENSHPEYVNGYELSGQVISEENWYPTPGVDSVGYNTYDDGDLDSNDKHSMSSFVIRYYAEVGGANDSALSTDWQNAAPYFWAVLYDDQLAQAIGADAKDGTLKDEGKYAEIVRTAIAYSSLEKNVDGTGLIFGDTGIRALYDDANDLGARIADPLSGDLFDTYGTVISRAFVEFAGSLALHEIEKTEFAGAINGVLSHDATNHTLTVNYADALWIAAGKGANDIIVSRENIVEQAFGVDETQLRTAMWDLWQNDGNAVFDKVIFSTVAHSLTVIPSSADTEYGLVIANGNNQDYQSRVEIDDDANYLVIGSDAKDIIVTGAGDTIVSGGAGDDDITGGVGQDIIFGGVGQDHVESGAGADVVYGGDDNDTFIAQIGPMGLGGDTYYGGDATSRGSVDGWDVVDYRQLDTELYGLAFEQVDAGHRRLFMYVKNPGEAQPLVFENYDDLYSIESILHNDYLFDVQFGDEVANNIRAGDSGGSGGGIVYGRGGNDVLRGASYDTNYLFGEDGNDTLYSGDAVNGSKNFLWGGSGDDTLVGDRGENHLYGETGNDTLTIANGGSGVYDGGADFDLVSGNLTNKMYLFADTLSEGGTYTFVDADGNNSLTVKNMERVGLTLSQTHIAVTDTQSFSNYYYANDGEFNYLSLYKAIFDFSGSETALTHDTAGYGYVNGVYTLMDYEVNGGSYTHYVQNVAGVVGSNMGDTYNLNSQQTTLYMGTGDDTVNMGSRTANDVIYSGGNDVFYSEYYLPGITVDAKFLNTDATVTINSSLYDNGLSKLDILFTFDADNSIHIIWEGSSYSASSSLKFYNATRIDFNGPQLMNPGSPDAYVKAAEYSLVGSTPVASTLEGTLGHDTIVSRSGYGQALIGLWGDDKLYGYDGADTLQGGAGDDTLYGGTGDDVLTGGADNDEFIFESGFGHDTITDFVRGSDKITFDSLSGIDDMSDLTFSAETPTSTRIAVDSNNWVIVANQEFDSWLVSDFGFSTLLPVNGTSANDILDGTSAAEEFHAGAGNDYVYAGAGNDVLYGEDGDDILAGQFGNDTLYGGNGGDYLWGNEGNDTLYGGAGVDALRGLEGDDILHGGDGNDNLRGDDVDSDPSFAGAGNDILYGDAGNDSLAGGAGNDILRGGTGQDSLWGNAGSDTFLFMAEDLDGNRDYIYDFTVGSGGDMIDISDVLSGYDSANDNLADFVSILTGGSYTRISVDIDGTGTNYGSQSIIQIQGVTGLTLNDLTTNGNLIVEAA
ncbi:type I secretion C-terminal target domain (VC_A0849 subclass) [Sphingomonas laterariae]|uniref:Type I secretion C-terminal target domain (VC_A0849 subclass) n=1 Tax=Edaphosphingomonas laterariae TaxID=861865 RepID=A0A239IXK6_9SPHN|nr:type I secretion C-terminal target domain-containing protein [Sphingomonas laterariae]SNS98357.1 type I secretion C-terminal target domain (VC_A0849 subclass) [Sphingomonas laterariae]